MNPGPALIGLVAATVIATGAQAQVTVDISKITCEQFAFSKVGPVRSVALWLSGYYNGKRGSTVVDAQAFDANAEKLELFCKQQSNLKLPVMRAVEQLFSKK